MRVKGQTDQPNGWRWGQWHGLDGLWGARTALPDEQVLLHMPRPTDAGRPVLAHGHPAASVLLVGSPLDDNDVQGRGASHLSARLTCTGRWPPSGSAAAPDRTPALISPVRM